MSDELREAELAVLEGALSQGLVRWNTVREVVLLREDLEPAQRPETVLSLLPLSVKETKAFLTLHAQFLTPGPPPEFVLTGPLVKRAEELASVPEEEDPEGPRGFLQALKQRVESSEAQAAEKARAKAQAKAEAAARAKARDEEDAIAKARAQVVAEVEAYEAQKSGKPKPEKAVPAWARDALSAHGADASDTGPAEPAPAPKKAVPAWARDAVSAHEAETESKAETEAEAETETETETETEAETEAEPEPETETETETGAEPEPSGTQAVGAALASARRHAPPRRP
ncbi:MAG: hypothetical protein KDD82_17325, partial [Planctomycetes bacterium]|nr:hypothetical protein [Planctomycetota bacterium]